MNGKTIVKSIHGYKITEIAAVYQPCLTPNSAGRISYDNFTLTYADSDHRPVTGKFCIEKIEDEIGYEDLNPEPKLTRTLTVFIVS